MVALTAECPVECREPRDQRAVIEKNLKRLNDVKTVNLEFISKLDADQESKRLKAASNVSIAEKRMAELQKTKDALEATLRAHPCDICEDG